MIDIQTDGKIQDGERERTGGFENIYQTSRSLPRDGRRAQKSRGMRAALRIRREETNTKERETFHRPAARVGQEMRGCPVPGGGVELKRAIEGKGGRSLVSQLTHSTCNSPPSRAGLGGA